MSPLLIDTKGGKVKIGICERFRVVIHVIFTCFSGNQVQSKFRGSDIPMHVEGHPDWAYALPAQSPPADSITRLLKSQNKTQNVHKVRLITMLCSWKWSIKLQLCDWGKYAVGMPFDQDEVYIQRQRGIYFTQQVGSTIGCPVATSLGTVGSYLDQNQTLK